MVDEPPKLTGEDRWPIAASGLIVVITVATLYWLDRFWWCNCGEPFLWSGDVWSEHNSQHLADAYSFTHLAHGLIFAVLCRYTPPFRGWSFCWRFTLGNSLGDIAGFAIGFVLASRIAWYWSLAIFLVMEVVLLVLIRDNLLLNVLMLLWPIDAVRDWQVQMAG